MATGQAPQDIRNQTRRPSLWLIRWPFESSWQPHFVSKPLLFFLSFVNIYSIYSALKIKLLTLFPLPSQPPQLALPTTTTTYTHIPQEPHHKIILVRHLYLPLQYLPLSSILQLLNYSITHLVLSWPFSALFPPNIPHHHHHHTIHLTWLLSTLLGQLRGVHPINSFVQRQPL